METIVARKKNPAAKSAVRKASDETLPTGKEPDEISLLEVEYMNMFASLDSDGKGYFHLSDLLHLFREVGIRPDDSRLKLTDNNLGGASASSSDEQKISYEEFKRILQRSKGHLVRDAIQGNLVIPDFHDFRRELMRIYELTKSNKEGHVATYIPQLGRVDPEQYAVSVCTIDGQRFSIGDSQTNFCIQSICKPINYCLILEEHGEEKVHSHIGREPSGIGFNGLVLNNRKLPHNPMINAGAIMACSLVKPQLDMADRFDHVLDMWTQLSGNQQIGFNNSVYLSERQTADRNFALGYFMRENKSFPENTALIDTLEFYFQCCSIELNAEALAVTAATLANGGICPTTGSRVLRPDTVKNCLSLMYSCGMYDFSGEFAFTIGLPAKSGVAGGLMVVIPNIMGFCVWSPRLDVLGNTVRGIEFCKHLVSTYNFHNYDSLTSSYSRKKDPRLKRNESRINGVISLCWAASEGDLLEVQHLVARGVEIDTADYDGRTALHLAASEGHEHIIEYLISKNARKSPVDRWGNTPLDDARRAGHAGVVQLLEQRNA